MVSQLERKGKRLGNVWRFPYIVYEYGGGTFLFVYWFIFFLVALPMFFMELSMGQFASAGPIGIFRNLAPAFEGIGYAILAVQTLSAIYYNSLLTYSLFYTFSSMQPTMPWQSCTHEWSSPVWCIFDLILCNPNVSFLFFKHCFTTSAYQDCVGEGKGDYMLRWYVKGTCYNETTILDFFKNLDRCIYNSDKLPIPTECRVKLDFDFGNKNLKNLTPEVMLGQKGWSGVLFLSYSSCQEWIQPEKPQDLGGTLKLVWKPHL
ncbi:MAG: hypothetical protein GY696_17475 [Gammaproteobacteria bacterium]|nr:hypothetical protein [Gammaproteobacteria bacterium]